MSYLNPESPTVTFLQRAAAYADKSKVYHPVAIADLFASLEDDMTIADIILTLSEYVKITEETNA